MAMRFWIGLACAVVLPAQNNDARRDLNTYLARIGETQLAQREKAIAAIQTREEAERRQAAVRAKILKLMGGLPEHKGPARVKEFGSIEEEGFRIEKIAYESLPEFWVTANVYVPKGNGPFPAVVVSPGHGAGKESNASWAANLARNGIVALAIDTFGAAERYQHYDPEIETSKIETMGEHEHAGLSTLLIGKHVSRYFVNDAMRGVDYLTQRKDVDKAHLGAFGCSGGGTVTAYLAALDPRISVTATACYITSWKELLNSQGAQDAEQTLPGFVAEGLDFADWIELCAPRPYAIVATTNDMFPFAGVQTTYEEVKKVYGLYGAADRVQLISGPGGHGNLGPITPQIMAFLVGHLKENAQPVEFRPFRISADKLIVTPTGQVATSLGGETVESVNRKEARAVVVAGKVLDSKVALAELQKRVREQVRSVAGVTAASGEAPQITVLATEPKDGYHIEKLTMHSEPGIDLAAVAVVPERTGPKPAVLMMQEGPIERAAATPDVQQLTKSGHVVMLLQPRGIDSDAPVPRGQTSILGPNTAIALQAMAVGKSLVGMRADDLIRAVNWLASLPDVNKSAITVYARGAEGMAALHAAAVDERMARVVVENTLVSYRMALEAPLHRNLSDIILPGVLRHYDTSDLLRAISPRAVVLVNAADAMGLAARSEVIDQELSAVFESDRRLGTVERVRTVRRGFRDPLPF